ncbi:unnamed protein product [Echinostoma caproni]|uniref:OAR domain-containing protein n=1 Tax=Echinostoma caproni TaxID=27848 RepID=A0A183B6H7_9TREM|nr:unnamed protein product [Echinostoma caproni]
MYTGSSLVVPIGAMTSSTTSVPSRAVSESRFSCPPQSVTPVGNPLNYSASNTGTNQSSGLCVDATNMDNTMWTSSYLPTAAAVAAAAAAATGSGTGNLWIPPAAAYPNYAHHYYPALSVPVASISSPGLVNYEDPTALQQNTVVDRCYSNPAISIGDKYPSQTQDYYYSPGANISPGSVWTGPSKISGPQTYTPLPMLGPSTSSSIFSSVNTTQPQVGTTTNANSWQMLLNALTAQKNNQSLNSTLIRPPFSSYTLSLDRARLSGGRRRMPINYAARPITCKEFNPAELQSLGLG